MIRALALIIRLALFRLGGNAILLKNSCSSMNNNNKISQDSAVVHSLRFRCCLHSAIAGVLTVVPIELRQEAHYDRGSGPKNVNFLNGPKIVSE
jgi:hypothetical protein